MAAGIALERRRPMKIGHMPIRGRYGSHQPKRGGSLDLRRSQDTSQKMNKAILDPSTTSEIIEMALSDHVSFEQIRALHGLGPDDVKALMRQNLKSGSYRAWRKRVRAFADRREVYK